MARFVVHVRKDRAADEDGGMYKAYVRTVSESGGMRTVAVGPWRRSQVEAARDGEAGMREARRAA